jgi:hypothetical protein
VPKVDNNVQMQTKIDLSDLEYLIANPDEASLGVTYQIETDQVTNLDAIRQFVRDTDENDAPVIKELGISHPTSYGWIEVPVIRDNAVVDTTGTLILEYNRDINLFRLTIEELHFVNGWAYAQAFCTFTVPQGAALAIRRRATAGFSLAGNTGRIPAGIDLIATSDGGIGRLILYCYNSTNYYNYCPEGNLYFGTVL